jgi:hypothetical protein
VPQKTHRSETSGKNDQNEYATFTGALKKILSVSHADLKKKLSIQKRKKKRASREGGAED